MGCQSGIGSRTPLDAKTRDPCGGAQGCRWQWPLAQQSSVKSDHRCVVDADGSTPLRLLLPSFNGHCWTERDITQLLHRLTDPRQILGKNRNDQRGALDFRNSPNARRAALREHDFQWSEPTEFNDRPDFENRVYPQPVPFIDLRREAARRALFIETAFPERF